MEQLQYILYQKKYLRNILAYVDDSLTVKLYNKTRIIYATRSQNLSVAFICLLPFELDYSTIHNGTTEALVDIEGFDLFSPGDESTSQNITFLFITKSF